MQKIREIVLSRWFWLLSAILLIISRLATWFFPFDSDHWIFYYIGRKWSENSILYLDMWDHKSPLIYAYNALLHTLFGDNLLLHRIFFTLIALIVVWLFYKTSQYLFDYLKIKNHEFVARVTTLLFIFLTNLSQFTNSGNNNENIGLLVLLGCLYCYLLYRKQPMQRQGLLLASGLFAGFVFLLKANFAILLLPIIVDIIYIHRKNIFKIFTNLCLFGFGIFLQLLIWVWYFESINTFKYFYIATFEFNSKYIKSLGWDTSSPNIIIFIGILLLLLLFFTLFIIESLKIYKKADKQLGYFIPLLAISALLFILLAGTFYSHYFLIVIPYLCLVAGATSKAVFAKRKKAKLTLLSLIILLMLLASYKQLYNNFYGSVAEDFKNQTTVAEYIKNNTKPSDKIFANMYGATFYRLSQRDSGSRFISASHPLIDYKYEFGYGFNIKFIFDMEDASTKYIIMSSDKYDIYRTQNPVLMRYITNNYQLETTLENYDIYKRNN